MTTGIASGLGATIGWSQEGTVGTFTTPTEFQPFNKETLAWKKNVTQSKALHGGLYLLGSHRALITHTADGMISMDLMDRGLGLLWKNALGATPILAAGASSTYQWVFSPADLTGSSMSVQVGRPATNGTIIPFSYNGGKVTSLEIGVKDNAIGTFDVGFDFWNEVNTSPALTAPSYVANNVLQFAQASLFSGGTVVPVASTTSTGSQTLPSGTLNVASTTGFPLSGTIYVTTTAASPNTVQVVNYTGGGGGGTSFTGCTGGTGTVSASSAVTTGQVQVTGATKIASATDCSIKQENKLNVARYFLGSNGTKAEQLANDFRAISGTSNFEFASIADVYTAFQADTPLALSLQFVGPIIAGSVTSAVNILIPQIRWEGSTPSVGGPEVLTYAAPFTGLDDGVDSQMQVQLVSLDSTL